MNLRLIKELRPLLIPGCIVLATGCLLPILRTFHKGGDWAPMQLALFIFFLGIVLISVLPFGAELQDRTLPMLLSQPCPRTRFWLEKLGVAAFVILAAVLMVFLVAILVEWLVSIPRVDTFFTALQDTVRPGPDEPWSESTRTAARSPSDGPFYGAMFLIATICSATFWTLTARGIIGGIAFTVCGQFAVYLGASFLLGKMYGTGSISNSTMVVGTVGAGSLYSVLLLYLGWRKFARLELCDGLADTLLAGERGPATAHGWERRWRRILRVRRGRATLNLVLKELRLQKPLVAMAGVFSACWVLGLILMLLLPARQDSFEFILNGLTVVYVPLFLVLAGCVSVSEEKALGTAAWHLTLPLHGKRQWLMKLLITFVLGLGLGVFLPMAWSFLALFKTKVGLLGVMVEDGWLLLTYAGLVLLASFWAATLLGSVVRAVLATILAFLGGTFCATTAAWLGNSLGGLQTPLLFAIVAQFQLPVGHFMAGIDFKILFTVGITIVVAVLLWQSLLLFCRPPMHNFAIGKHAVILALSIFIPVFLFTDVVVSRARLANLIPREISRAIQSLPPGTLQTQVAQFKAPRPQMLSVDTLAQSGQLSALTRRWLRNAYILLVQLKGVPGNGHADEALSYSVSICLPDSSASTEDKPLFQGNLKLEPTAVPGGTDPR